MRGLAPSIAAPNAPVDSRSERVLSWPAPNGAEPARSTFPAPQAGGDTAGPGDPERRRRAQVVRDDTGLADLMRSALDGDKAAYAVFLRQTAALVRAIVRRKLRPGSALDAEDIVQDTLLAIHLKRHTWRRDGPITPWLAAIARHKTIDAFRRRGAHVELDISDFAELLPAPEVENASEKEVSHALEGLAPRQRSVVGAVTIEGRSIRDTAARLGMTEVAVRVSLHRGLAAIRARIGKTNP